MKPSPQGFFKKVIAAAVIITAGFAYCSFGAGASSSLVRIPFKGPAQLNKLASRHIEVLSFSPKGYIDVAADAKDIAFLFSLGYDVSIIADSGMSLASPALGADLGLYHTYAEMETAMLNLESSYPALAKVSVIGTSIEGRSIYSLKISDNVALDEDEPEVLIMGNHHAREIMTVEIPLKLAEYLLGNYAGDPSVKNLVDNREIFIVPSVNPDGHVYVELNHTGAWWTWWRKNRRDNGDNTFGVDLNRNYGYLWGYDDFGSSPSTSSEVYRGTSAFSEPETQAVSSFAQGRSFVMALSYHSYGEMLLYPWGYNYSYTSDHELFLALGDTLAYSNGYNAGNSAMGAIYTTNGDTDDWEYGDSTTKNSFFGFTPEVNSDAEGGFAPPDTLIQPTFDFLLPMNMKFLELADNPARILGPGAPVMYPVVDSPFTGYIVSWTAGMPSDPNQAISYDLVEYMNFHSIADHADVLAPEWTSSGFSIGSRAFEGTGSYYSGSGDGLSNTLMTATPFPVTAANDTFTCEIWYDIESDYDYAYIEASTNDGLTWETVSGNVTTNSNPYGVNHGNGMTGSSGGWTHAVFPLSAYTGSDITLRVHYITDGYVSNEGIYVDMIDQVPSYDTRTVMASAAPDTSLLVTPQSVGTFTYIARGHDSDGQIGRWSVSVSKTVDQLSGSDESPAFASWLGGNYPNPFNPSTTIPYHVGGPAGGPPVKVSLAVYDVAGRLVRVLADKTAQPGLYRAVWNGRNDRDEHIGSGIYFARLIIDGSQSFARKLVYIK